MLPFALVSALLVGVAAPAESAAPSRSVRLQHGSFPASNDAASDGKVYAGLAYHSP